MATIVIEVNAVDLTDIILFETARFDSRVNGEPGSCEFRVRDDNSSLSFEAGQSITVDINGEREWTGYLMQATSTYIFPAGQLDEVIPRIWKITGVDLNILFRRRIVFDATDPTVMTGKTYKYTGTPTPDTTAIADLVADFLDLSGDGLDVTTFVDNVGNINVDQDVNAFGASWTWEQAMTSIASIPAAIYYIDPDRNLVYTDVDTVNAPFGISDQPDGSTTFGYREPELLKDASNLINEYLAWGIGTGSNVPVFSRLEDTTSVDTHGRWQQASLTYDVYTQATVDRIADSWINGSPSSQRGHKDDKIAFLCTIFEPGIRAGMKVDVTSNVFGFNDVMPVRECNLTFASQTDPAYRLTLSHAIDAPWSFYEMFNPSIPRFAFEDVHVVSSDCRADCASMIDPGVFDNFNRVLSGQWGNSTPTGYTWVLTTTGGGTGDPSVNGLAGLLAATLTANGTRSHLMTITGLGPFTSSFVMTTKFRFSAQGASGKAARLRYRVDLVNSVGFNIVTNVTGTLGFVELVRAGNFLAGSDSFALTPNVDYDVEWEHCFGNFSRIRVWPTGTAKPAAWSVERDATGENQSPDGLSVEWAVTRSIGATTSYSNTATVDYIIFECLATPEFGPSVSALTTDGTDTISLGSPFWKGTSRVWLDGKAQRLGADYTEDYDGGSITFTSTPASGLDVVVTRVTKTPCGGGASRRLI